MVKTYIYKLLSKYQRLARIARTVYSKLYSLRYTVNLGERLRHVEHMMRRAGITGSPRDNVILIVIDCLRYRNMSFTGYYRKTTPYLDSFKIKLKAYSPAPHTYSSVPSILSGLYPHVHGAIIGGLVEDMYLLKDYKPIARDTLLLPEILKAFGYDVVVYSTIFPVLMAIRNTAVSVLDVDKTLAQRVLARALGRIRKSARSGKRFFVYIHLGDLHVPLKPRQSIVISLGM